MGFFKQVKDMKDMVHEAPDLIAQSNQMAANAQVMAAAQQAQAQQAMAGATAPTTFASSLSSAVSGDMAPIAGVSIELYAEISRSFAEVGYDQTKGPELAARHGVSATDWELALAGWNDRITNNPTVASRFNALYTGR
ncbi:hypothetical protein [Aquihabitans sp. McL0605]|uniref:hypothetical protein n=1 Tax=Aquihabitans sp. McL0605 TaxID=3415671 RepID=UPI003CF1B179